ncbi:dTDP-4-dehydrorhamnose reductase [Vallitalea pronyensis]|uniref:dTDP-4-dehydrorhamnose reductase n=1 Tax=Vallitalea pronyensis TaxID=1348613 RepID=A0A8J8MNK5_9FIRM|nr:dTDP-4-dehydrorhamnose reductase [Vallitalea pronyensis]QUI24789.1 dTDP-4-dehydrorhamnose reductase [Vallitalea pronyensis]
MKILVTGAKGQLGRDITWTLSKDHHVMGLGREVCDIRDMELIKYYMHNFQPDMVINCASITHVDACETNTLLAMDVNAYGVKNLACICQQMHVLLVHISTDYVFDGQYGLPYEVCHSPNPINAYGYSKWLGEQYVKRICSKYYILRTSWLFGPYGYNFVNKIMDQIPYKDTLYVVDDQVGSPTYTQDFILMLRGIITSNCYGIYHVANNGSCSRYAFAKTIIRYLKEENTKVLPIQSHTVLTGAERPKYSVLSNKKAEDLCGQTMPTWEDALKRFIHSFTLQHKML